ncbi:MAG: PQQ-binding-like beta-propeller repeat protein, partial [Sphingomonadaceae bacterium]|nr:PQQ-binding-like beta-propeller repeat protein [Sphingomonadaceae bacterium]
MTDLTPLQDAAPARRRWQRWPLAAASLIAGVAALNGGPGGAIDARAAPAAPTPEAVYAEVCANCHGARFEGGAGPALIGPAFTAKWQGQPDAALFTISHDLMPLNAPQSLPVEQSRAILDHIYAANRLTVTAGVITAGVGTPAVAAAAPAKSLPSVPATVAQPQGTLPQAATLLAPAGSDWLMYNRDYRGQRYSPLAQITSRNAGRLAPRCIFQAGEIGSFQTSPVAHNGVLYITTPYATYAVDGATCAKRWEHVHVPTGAEGLANNRGVALADGRLIRGTPDGHLIALDAATGTLLWDVHVVDSVGRYAISSAITAYDGKVFTGLAGGDRGGTGRIFAFEAATGKHLWTFNTVPRDGEFGAETWGGGQHVGGGGSWTTITVDPDTRQLL